MKYFSKILIILIILSMLVSCDLFSFLPSEQGTTTTNLGSSSTSTTTTTFKDPITFDPDEDFGPTNDPYVGMSKEEFYSNYKPATSYRDAQFRTLHGFMSGSIEEQDQAPTIADYQPKENGKFIRNTSAVYSSDKNTYYILDGYGKIVNRVFKGGAYVSLEEVAAYLMAFGEIPPNYTSKKSGSPSNSIWGEYLRLNHSKFSGDTSKYPYEPVLPDISGCGGNLQYYEIDIGTTGTDCDPSFVCTVYNNGSKITRGAARIVYTVYDQNKNKIIDVNEKYLFYTYNHYNDFQEYLNYEGGWGEIFGNITGGGTISSKYDYRPTAYVTVLRRDFWQGSPESAEVHYIIELAYIHFNTKLYSNSTACA